MTLFLASFLAGVLTILAPCVLPVLPVILAGSLSEKKSWYPSVVTFSLAISVVLFTVLLKVSTLFIGIPSDFWKYVSGVILILLGLVYVFPHTWIRLSSYVFGSRANTSLDKTQDISSPLWRAIITGAALGPVFSTCSPTYTLLLATVFPVSLLAGIGYTFVYALGLSLMLTLITIGGRSLIARLRWLADEQGRFRRFLGIVFLLIGLAIITGLDKRLESAVLSTWDIPAIETTVLSGLGFTSVISSPSLSMTSPIVSNGSLQKAYFAGGCFWCMEGIFEAQTGVTQAVSGYAEGDASDADYTSVSSGRTKHREAVEVTYDPSVISYATLVDLYYTQIDPTQTDGQFADRGFRYTTAIYYQDAAEQKIIDQARETLESSHKFDKPIAVTTVPFTTFFPAEEYHQDYYTKSAFRYNLYKQGSGRAGYIHENGQTGATLPTDPTTPSQYRDYDEQVLSSLTGLQILLFFHADWCPTCQNFEKQILAKPLPPGVIILKVDYDRATELKKKYSVLSQSTWIQIDSSGNMYKRWLGKSDLADILSDLVPQREILSKKLTPLQFEVTQMGGTEKPFDNAYWNNHEAGIYVDIVDGTPLFSSTDKFDSGTGWPSFTRPIADHMVSEHLDTKLAMNRTEVKSTAGSHLGHVFTDGPSEEGGLRYCINSAALRFVPVADLEREGYGKYMSLFGSGSHQK